jgi:hypothetical protein
MGEVLLSDSYPLLSVAKLRNLNLINKNMKRRKTKGEKWLETRLKGEIMLGTNNFSDIAVIQLLNEYRKYLEKKS